MDLNQRLLKQSSYINGQWLPVSDNTFAVLNPANGQQIASLANATADDATAAVAAANKAMPAWQALPAKNRSRILRRWFDLIMQHKADLAAILTAEQGKPVSESLGEIVYGANYIEWFAEEAKRVYGDTIPQPSSDNR